MAQYALHCRLGAIVNIIMQKLLTPRLRAYELLIDDGRFVVDACQLERCSLLPVG